MTLKINMFKLENDQFSLDRIKQHNSSLFVCWCKWHAAGHFGWTSNQVSAISSSCGVKGSFIRISHLAPWMHHLLQDPVPEGSHLKKECQGKTLAMWNFEGRLSNWCCTTEKWWGELLLRFCHLNMGSYMYNHFCIGFTTSKTCFLLNLKNSQIILIFKKKIVIGNFRW